MEQQFCKKCGALLGMDEQEVCHCCYTEPGVEEQTEMPAHES
ncbi:hypothetical protein NE562_12155 [Butyricicoccus faecihominis]|nr:hypothetical protein [Butyricicoccus faecihominis]MCQ5130416.1 hypothetical protein [Butyricicoccus faecihominis]